MITAVLFDFGGVLSRFGHAGDLLSRVAVTLGADRRLVNSQVGELFEQVLCGKLPTSAFWLQASELLGRPAADYDALWRANEPREFEILYYNFARQLRDRGLATGILSNVFPTSVPLIRAAGGYRDFFPTVLSCEVGLLKPDPRIYKLALARLHNRPAAEVLLIDDQPASRAAAEALGMGTLAATTDPREMIALIETKLATG